MTCNVCGTPIENTDKRAYTWVGDKQIAACLECNQNGRFAAFVDDVWDKAAERAGIKDQTENVP